MNNTDNIFVWSDTHFHHTNIMKFCPETRPFLNVDEMNEGLIKAWNSAVGDKTIFFLGDFSFSHKTEEISSIFERLSGEKYLIRGNHDKKETTRLPWKGVFEYREVYVADEKFVLCHYPLSSWNNIRRGAYHLFGHVHGNYVPGKNNLRMDDVGVDNGYPAPVSLSEMMSKLQNRQKVEFTWGDENA